MSNKKVSRSYIREKLDKAERAIIDAKIELDKLESAKKTIINANLELDKLEEVDDISDFTELVADEPVSIEVLYAIRQLQAVKFNINNKGNPTIDFTDRDVRKFTEKSERLKSERMKDV